MHESVDTHMKRLMLWFMLLLTNVSLMGVVASLLVSPKLLKLACGLGLLFLVASFGKSRLCLVVA